MPDPTRPTPRRRARSSADRDLAARLLASLRDGNDVRAAEVERLRRDCAGDHYENDLKLAVAADRLFDAMAANPAEASPRPAARPAMRLCGVGAGDRD